MINKRVSSKLTMIVLAFLLIVTSFLVLANTSLAYAEELNTTAAANEVSTRGATKDILAVPVIGTLKDGNREYGSTVLNVNITRVNLTKYNVTVEAHQTTWNYKTDRYITKAFTVAVSGYTSISDINRIEGTDPATTITTNGASFSTTSNTENNNPLIKFSFTVLTYSTLKISLSGLKIEGKFLAKDTNHAGNYITLSIPISYDLTNSAVNMRYSSSLFGGGASYGTWYGPIPTNWTKSAL